MPLLRLWQIKPLYPAMGISLKLKEKAERVVLDSLIHPVGHPKVLLEFLEQTGLQEQPQSLVVVVEPDRQMRVR
jgi:hypothetical protein